MAFHVPIEVSRTFEPGCGYDQVFDLLANVPESASHFPKLEHLRDLGDTAYRWEMEKIGLGAYFIQTVYTCTYTDNREEGWIEWKPVEGEGNAVIEGFWNFEIDDDDTVHVEFYTRGDLTIDLPALVKIVLSPLVVVEFTGIIDTYINNLKKAFA